MLRPRRHKPANELIAHLCVVGVLFLEFFLHLFALFVCSVCITCQHLGVDISDSVGSLRFNLVNAAKLLHCFSTTCLYLLKIWMHIVLVLLQVGDNLACIFNVLVGLLQRVILNLVHLLSHFQTHWHRFHRVLPVGLVLFESLDLTDRQCFKRLQILVRRFFRPQRCNQSYALLHLFNAFLFGSELWLHKFFLLRFVKCLSNFFDRDHLGWPLFGLLMLGLIHWCLELEVRLELPQDSDQARMGSPISQHGVHVSVRVWVDLFVIHLVHEMDSWCGLRELE